MRFELDRSRQQVIKLEKELRDNIIAKLNQKVGSSTGVINELKRQLRLLEGKLATTSKKYELYKLKHKGISQN